MRCLHCGYVSFDHLSACRRCAQPLSPSSGHAPVASIPSPDADIPSDPRLLTSGEEGQEGWGPLEDRFAVGGDVSEDELDWNHLTLPSELRPASPPPIVYGGLLRRAVAVLVDAPFLFVITVLGMSLAFLTALGGGTVAGEVTLQVELVAVGAALVAAGAVVLTYHVLCWGQWGQTPGKMLVGLAVVREDGAAIGYGRAFLRWMAYLLAALPLGLGLLVALFHPRRRGLHDLLAGTSVVRVDAESKQ